MKCGLILLEMLKKYDVRCIFGLPGETTMDWYNEWKNFPDIEHILVRDERNAVFMADGYAKISGKPGLCEGPSVGAPHMLPGIVEAWSSCVPIIAITSDVPLNAEKHNMLTGADQTSMFKPFVKETLTAQKAADIPFIIRRAFRLATSGRPGPVHIRLPQDVLSEDIDVNDLYVQPDFICVPGKRSAASDNDISKAIDILSKSERGVIISGQGALVSKACDEIRLVSEKFGLAVLTTINGKGIISETHPLSGGIVGARGANSFSNGLVQEADVIFFVGSSTDSSGTATWKFPSKDTSASIIQLDISEAELGNNYPTQVLLLGDVKETLRKLLDSSNGFEKNYQSYLESIMAARDKYEQTLTDGYTNKSFPIHPMRLMRELGKAMPSESILVVDPGISAVYSAGFIKIKKAGRYFVCNYAQGALGYGTSAAIGAAKAAPNATIINITRDGSFGFCAGEFETLARVGCNVKVILINNHSFGWIRAVNSMAFDNEPFATQFADIDYMNIASGFGIPCKRVETAESLCNLLENFFEEKGPSFLEVACEAEDLCIPSVPSWAEKARQRGKKTYY